MHDILKSFHDGPCGEHLSDKRTSYKILQLGYYWPNIFKDATRYVKGCDNFQYIGRTTPTYEMHCIPGH